jgi:two-component system response regulator BaeR
MSDQKSILIVEDEPKIAQLLSDYLVEAGYQTSVCNDGSVAVELIGSLKPDCVLLDVMLPGKDGLTICKEVRQFSMVPVVMITARVDEIDRLLGLELGADDYICKPFSPREVVVRIRNILRRVQIVGASKVPIDGQEVYTSSRSKPPINYRSLQLDQDKFSCQFGELSTSLTAVEFRMLFAMANRPGCIFSRNQLMNVAYTDGRVVSDRTIDTHIKNIRKKLALKIDSEETVDDLIHSIYGVGYKVE